MEADGPQPIPECVFLEEKSGMKLYELKKTLLFSYNPKIKIVSIGNENDLDTRNIFLMGATGAGKTCLLNALVNHLFGVKFKDNYRYVLKDEIGNVNKNKAESQTEYVVGYLIYILPGSKRKFNYMIIDTPGLKDSKGEERQIEVLQQIRTFLQDVDGVDELHCIGFVVNGTTTRIQKEFKDIVEEFCRMFGENAKEIIRALISFGYMKRPTVIDVLKCSCLKDCKTCKFDNAYLYSCNQPTEDYSEEDIGTCINLWNQTAMVYNTFFDEVDHIKAVSLGLTRETLTEVSNLNETIERFKQMVKTYLDVVVNFKQCEDKCKEYQMIMNANQNWQGTVRVTRPKKKKGIQFWNPILFTEDKNETVIYQDKKNLYDEANKNLSSVQVQMASLQQQINEENNKINENVQNVIRHMANIKKNSLSHREHTSQEFIEQTLKQLKIEQLTQTTDTQRHMYVSSILDNLGTHIYTGIGSPE